MAGLCAIRRGSVGFGAVGPVTWREACLGQLRYGLAGQGRFDAARCDRLWWGGVGWRKAGAAALG